MATYAIGDIHGWRAPLDDLPGRIEPRLTAADTVVFLGDYIDRGDDSRGVIDAILAFRQRAPGPVGVPLPYAAFFAALPDAHREFFLSLDRFHESPDCICTHAGLHPSISDLGRQGRTLTWGHAKLPAEYRGLRPVAYGHTNHAALDTAGWPWPRIVGRAYGIDTIGHGVLTALCLPDAEVIQSARYDEAVRAGDD